MLLAGFSPAAKQFLTRTVLFDLARGQCRHRSGPRAVLAFGLHSRGDRGPPLGKGRFQTGGHAAEAKAAPLALNGKAHPLQAMGELRPIQRPHHHFGAVKILAFQRSRRTIRPHAQIQDQGMGMEIGVLGAAGTVLESSDH